MRALRNYIATISIAGILICAASWYLYIGLGGLGLIEISFSEEFGELMGHSRQKFTKPNKEEFLSGIYQTRFEKSFSENFPAYPRVIAAYRKSGRWFNKNTLWFLPRRWVPMLPVGGNVVKSWNGDRLFTSPAVYFPKNQNLLLKRARYYNKLANDNRSNRFYVIAIVPYENWMAESKSYYKGKTNILAGDKYVTSFRDLLDPKISYQWIGENLSPEETIALHYKTDHHFTMRGAYWTYRQIISIIQTNSGASEIGKPLLPKKWFIFPTITFRGSKARRAGGLLTFSDKFEDATFGLPTYSKREKKDRYFAGSYRSAPFTNHYAKYYGFDLPMITYTFKASPERNLLIIGDSYNNSMEPLLASHYRKSFFIDLRHYEKQVKEPFVIEDFISKNKINDVLFLGAQSWVLGLKEN